MIIVVRRTNILLIVLIFLLSIAVYSLNIGQKDDASVTLGPTMQRTVVVDAGHGGEDPGAVSDYSGIKEKDINLSIAKKLQELLEKDNYKVIMTRTEDILNYQTETNSIFQKRKEDLLNRKKIMDNSGADIIVSIHLNKFDQTQYWGAQTFYPPNSPESQKLAGVLQNALREVVDPNNNRQPQINNKGIVIFRNVKTPITIIECGFLSNAEEEKKLTTEEYQNKLAEAIKIGIDRYFTN